MSSQQQSTMDRFITRPKHNLAAWQLKPNKRPFVVGNAPYSSPPKDHVLIQVIDVAINPIDWILQENDIFGLKYPAILGDDVAGEIVEVGDGVEDLHAGQRVIAHCNGTSSKDATHGAFQRYTIVPKHAVAELPYSINTSRGVVLPLGISTAAAGLYQKGYLNLPFPTEKPDAQDRTVIIWGGSSSVGSCAIQLAVASGLHVVTTASPKNYDYCKDLGAKHCFDYHDEDVEDQIVKALEGKTIVGAYHAVGGDGAVQSCARIVDRTKGKAIVVTVRGVPEKGIPSSVRAKSSKSPFTYSSAEAIADARVSLVKCDLHERSWPIHLA
ncbi:hypothetical protein LTR78_008692 [Recurvomyces mirabilis]|uniref:Enoyl reductase (ER) domain-containing protein n=1 Tax=Recurvomyces mirabilis TaxID=574656 RepID=A0AAE0WIW5_9PEZI|nr:hypothetical protein LTR78_008692 [Recurvomyces mirabilis]